MPTTEPSASSTSKAHKFWDSQPVPHAEDAAAGNIGPIEKKTLADVSTTPVAIPSRLTWYTPNMLDDADLKEVYELLANNYVEDTDSIFRFNYSMDFLRWATTPPGHKPEWMVGIRPKSGGKPLAFIAGIPVHVRAGDKTLLLCEINFLCVNKVLRSAGLAPSLIQEVTRQVNLCDIYQAVYTVGKEITRPFTTCQYFHRSLNPQKLVAIGFSAIPQHLKRLQRPMDAMKRMLAVPDAPSVKGIRPMTVNDVRAVQALVEAQLRKYNVAAVLDEKDVKHWLLPREGVVYSYVVEAQGDGTVTDFISFYGLPSTVLGHATYTSLNSAYLFYYATTSTSLQALVTDVLVFAKRFGFDVFNMMDLMENLSFREPLKFGPGDGNLRYYFYNYAYPTIKPAELGLVML